MPALGTGGVGRQEELSCHSLAGRGCVVWESQPMTTEPPRGGLCFPATLPLRPVPLRPSRAAATMQQPCGQLGPHAPTLCRASRPVARRQAGALAQLLAPQCSWLGDSHGQVGPAGLYPVAASGLPGRDPLGWLQATRAGTAWASGSCPCLSPCSHTQAGCPRDGTCSRQGPQEPSQARWPP